MTSFDVPQELHLLPMCTSTLFIRRRPWICFGAWLRTKAKRRSH